MTKNLMMVCEAKLVMEAQGADKEPTGKIEACVTTWGAREGADGRKFNYQPEGFMDWAKTFSAEGKPLPMFLNHAADAMPVGEWTQFEFDDDGMTAEGRLYMNTTAGSDLYQIMKESPMMFLLVHTLMNTSMLTKTVCQ
jgi:phage head maturation protease